MHSSVPPCQCVICFEKRWRVEYVNTCMQKLFIMYYHRIEQYKRVDRTPKPPANQWRQSGLKSGGSWIRSQKKFLFQLKKLLFLSRNYHFYHLHLNSGQIFLFLEN